MTTDDSLAPTAGAASAEHSAASATADAAPPDAVGADAAAAQAAEWSRTGAWSCIIFDLDGTITDSAPGIVDRIDRMLHAVGRPVADRSELFSWVGPPMLESLARHGFAPDDARAALNQYRAISETEGPWEGSSVFPGIPELLTRVNEAGIPAAVASSKPLYQVSKVLEHFGLEHHFDVICGASADESISEKGDVIAEALRELRERGTDLSRMIYVGDRTYDVNGAAEHDIPAIVVGWGYGGRAEAAEAFAFAETVPDLERMLLGEAPA